MIKVFSRQQQRVVEEKVFGDRWLRWCYHPWSGQFSEYLARSSLFGKIYGKWQDSSFSKRKIRQFCQEFAIDLGDFLPDEGHNATDPYPNFNSFFIRRFCPDRRPFAQQGELLPAFAEARYFGLDQVGEKQTFPVKGQYLTPSALLASDYWQQLFQGGPILIARLAPVDYHRFHFPDDGRVLDQYHIPGILHSVNPVALRAHPEIFCRNERMVSILETINFGRLAYIEVGALGVGKIVQTYQGLNFQRGAEKGYFQFGGSTVIVLGEAQRWQIAPDILAHSLLEMETLVPLGEMVAKAFNAQGKA